jgi:deoxyribose-phosphate aldolase
MTAVQSSPFGLSHSRPRNPGTDIDLAWVREARANRSAIERRAATLGTRRTVKKEWQAAWLLRAISCMDLTTLAGDDTPSNVRRLCAKARSPIRQDIAEALGVAHLGITVGAVCVYHEMVETAVDALRGTSIPVAAVSTGFPAGMIPFKLRVAEIHESVAAGAREIDIVISRRHVLTGNWQALYDETREMRAACGAGRGSGTGTATRASDRPVADAVDPIPTSSRPSSVATTMPDL